MAPTNAELAGAISGVLASCRNFRQMYGRASPKQQETVMAGFPWPKRALELRELTAWAATTVSTLKAEDVPPVRVVEAVKRLAG